MRGHVAKKGNRYYAVVYEGVNPANGKDRHRWYAGGPTRREAEKLLTDLVKRKHDGHYRPPVKITFGAYLTDRWLPTKKAQLRASTYDSYRRNIELHVVPNLGSVQLQHLQADDLDTFYSRLLDCGRCDQRGGLSPKTVRYLHTIIHKALADAERKGTVVRNVAAFSEPPKLTSATKSEMRVWTGEQLRSFLDYAEEHALYSAFFLAANTGMRRGEVLGLRWKDVDLARSRLSVRQAVVSVAYEVAISDVKTGSARRTIDLDRRTMAVLRSWRKRQLEERLLVGTGGTYEGLVFARPDGRPIHPDFFSQCFDRLVAQAELPRIRLHDLRHTHATLLLQAGQPPKVVSERLGHSTPGFTMTVYQHVIPGMQAEAACAFSELVFGSERG